MDSWKSPIVLVTAAGVLVTALVFAVDRFTPQSPVVVVLERPETGAADVTEQPMPETPTPPASIETKSPAGPAALPTPAPAASRRLVSDPFRQNEQIAATVCADTSPFSFVVAKQGSAADTAIYVTAPAASARIPVGSHIEISPSCIVKLSRTGKHADFFAEFTFVERIKN